MKCFTCFKGKSLSKGDKYIISLLCVVVVGIKRDTEIMGRRKEKRKEGLYFFFVEKATLIRCGHIAVLSARCIISAPYHS